VTGRTLFRVDAPIRKRKQEDLANLTPSLKVSRGDTSKSNEEDRGALKKKIAEEGTTKA